MKPLVVDTSAIIAIITGEPEKDSLVQLTHGFSLIAPLSLDWEIGNALSNLLRRKVKRWADISDALQLYAQLSISLLAIELEESLQISQTLIQNFNYQFSPYAYDLYMVRCAIKYQAPLITLDKGLAQAATHMGVEVIKVRK